MGEMEKKGINILKEKYVMEDNEKEKDEDYEGIEEVIENEYLKKWKGKRIKWREWLKIWIKEGMKVYRDKEF